MSLHDHKAQSENQVDLNRVLIAEDDPIFRHILFRWLQSWGYDVVAADNGSAAWQVLSKEGSPRMAILDWMMPGMEGPELCRRIRARESGAYHYVLLLTARDNKQDMVEGFEAGADDYLTKPFDADELRARVRAGHRILELQAELLASQQLLQIEAAHDRLTGLCNRGAVLDRLSVELERRRRTLDPLGVIIADIDHFKQVNDTYGHLVGDSVLREVAHRLESTVRTYDCVGRYGGEEFLIVVPGCSASDLAALAERLRISVFATPIQTSARPLTVSVSLGLVCAAASASSDLIGEDLVQRADAALYVAKKAGRNRVDISEFSSSISHVR